MHHVGEDRTEIMALMASVTSPIQLAASGPTATGRTSAAASLTAGRPGSSRCPGDPALTLASLSPGAGPGIPDHRSRG